MMDCTRYLAMIQKELDGELSELEVKILEKHLSQCPSCAEEYRAFRVVADMLDGLEMLEPPLELKAAVMDRIMQLELAPQEVTCDATLSLSAVESKTKLAEAVSSDAAIPVVTQKKRLGWFIGAATLNAVFFSYWMISLTGFGFNRYHLLVFYKILVQSFTRCVVIGRYTGDAVQIVLKTLAHVVPWNWVFIYLTMMGILAVSLWTLIRRKGGDLT